MLHGLLRGRPLLYPCQQHLCEPEKLGACLFDPSHFGLRLIVSFYRAMQSFAEGSSCWSYDDTVQSFLEARKVRFEHIDDAMLRDASEVAAYHKPCIDRTLCYQGRQNDQVIQLHATHHYRGDSASCMIFVGQEEAFRHHSCPTYDLHKHDGAGKRVLQGARAAAARRDPPPHFSGPSTTWRSTPRRIGSGRGVVSISSTARPSRCPTRRRTRPRTPSMGSRSRAAASPWPGSSS